MAPIAKFINSRSCWIAILGLASFCAFLFGIAGVGRPGGFSNGQFDMSFLYVAGRCLRQGLSPYEPWFFAACSLGLVPAPGNEIYAYPPQMGFLDILLSYLPFLWARAIVTSINLFCLIGLAALCGSAPKSMSDIGVPDPAPESRWLIPAIIIGNPFTAHVLWMGQTTLIATTCLVAGWIWARRGHLWLPGLLIGTSTIKPQITALVVLWLLLERRWKILAIGASWALLLSLPEILAIGPIEAFAGWISAMAKYAQVDVNLVGNKHVFGLGSFLKAFGFNTPPLFLVLVGLASVMGIWSFRKLIDDRDILPLLVTLSLLFIFSHDYDLAALAVMLPAFWRHLRAKEVHAIVAVIALVLLFLPVRVFQEGFFAQYRVLIVLALGIWLTILSLRDIKVQVTDPSRPVPKAG
jgi:hypothetical protein